MFREGADEELRVGTVSAQSVHLGEADEDGVPWFDVLDAGSGDTAMYTDLIDSDGSGYSDWVEATLEPFGSDLLILDRIRIKPEYRGHGYGLYAAQLMITGFASNGVVACVPAPYELIENAPPRDYRRSSEESRQANSGLDGCRSKATQAVVAAWIRTSPKLRRLRSVPDRAPSLDRDCDAQVSCG